MTEENLILTNWLEQKKNFNENLTICRKRPTKDSVHDLRVAVKKMRAYLRLNEQLTGDKWKESFSKIADLFRSLGRQSDFDVSIQLINKHRRKEDLTLPYFRNYLSVNRSLARKWTKQDATRFNETDQPVFGQQFNVKLTNEEITEKIVELSAIKIKNVKNLAKHFQKNAHKIRKQLKDVYYWIKICPEVVIENFIRIRALDKTLEDIGNWQDYFVLRKKIKVYIKTIAKNEEIVILHTLDKSLVHAQDTLLEKAFKTWKETESKF